MTSTTTTTVPDETTAQELDALVVSAAAAADRWAATPRPVRAAALRAVAQRLEAAVETLVPIGIRETHLPEARLRGELRRTTFQLELFAEVLEEGSYLGVRIDHADPDWPMGAPRPDLRRILHPVGPVVIFAASNFPFAFSIAGGDTASALAAGCPVIVKAHPGHPELSAATGAIVAEALAGAGAPVGVFAVIFGSDAGVAALRAPAVKAVAFTGSIAGGRALFDVAAARPEPIPFYGELGSTNPVFVTAAAAAARAEEIVAGFIGSFTLGAGQFCTKPGVLLVPAGSGIVDKLTAATYPQPAPLLNDRIAAGFRGGLDTLVAHADVELVTGGSPAADPAPTVLRTTIEALLDDPDVLLQECFGPAALVVEYTDDKQLPAVIDVLHGQLTATVVAQDDDAIAPELVGRLITKVGRLLWNQWPTGVSVTYAQQHGGPYPATTAPSTTSVGTDAIGRFLRPVAYQGFPEHLLPAELRDTPPTDHAVLRRVDGRLPG